MPRTHNKIDTDKKKTHTLRNAKGKPSIRLNPNGSVKIYRYYENGLLKETLKLNTLLKVDTLLEMDLDLIEEFLIAAHRSEIHRQYYIYDKNGYEIFRVDELGRVTEFIYDSKGMWTEKINYLICINPWTLQKFTPDEIRKLLGNSEKRHILIRLEDHHEIRPRVSHPASLQANEIDYQALWNIANALTRNSDSYYDYLFQKNGTLKPIVYQSNNLIALAKILTVLPTEAARIITAGLPEPFCAENFRDPVQIILFMHLFPTASERLNLPLFLKKMITKREAKFGPTPYVLRALCNNPEQAAKLTKQAWVIDLIRNIDELIQIIQNFPHLSCDLLAQTSNKLLFTKASQVIDILIASSSALSYFVQQEKWSELVLEEADIEKLIRYFPDMARALNLQNLYITTQDFSYDVGGRLITITDKNERLHPNLNLEHNPGLIHGQAEQPDLMDNDTVTLTMNIYDKLGNITKTTSRKAFVLKKVLTLLFNRPDVKRSADSSSNAEIDLARQDEKEDPAPAAINSKKILKAIRNQTNNSFPAFRYLFLMTCPTDKALLAIELTKQFLSTKTADSSDSILKSLNKILNIFIFQFEPMDIGSILPVLHALENQPEPTAYLIRGILLQQAAEFAVQDGVNQETIEIMLLDAMRALAKAFMELPEKKPQIAIKELLWHIGTIQGESFPPVKSYCDRLYFEFQEKEDIANFVSTHNHFSAPHAKKRTYKPSINFLLEQSLFFKWMQKMHEDNIKQRKDVSTVLLKQPSP